MNAADLVIGIDSSTQSTKAVAFDAHGHVVAEGRAPIVMSSPHPAWMEQDPEEWWGSLCAALRQLWTRVHPERVAAVAVANQRETIALLDEHGRAVRPAITWLDERARDTLPALASALGADLIHHTTGRPVDLTPPLCRLAWLRDHESGAYARTRTFADVQSFLNLRLAGTLAAGWASCDPLGTFDIHARAWSAPILAYLDLDETRFSRPVRPGTALGTVTPSAARDTGLREGTLLVAGGGDGQCAALGTGCLAPGRAYVNLGTAIVFGAWSPEARIDSHWRTLLSASGQGFLHETVQRTGAYLITWFLRTFVEGASSTEALAALERDASRVPLGADGLITLPYWSGCMNPHWDPDARGVLVGLGSGHTRAHVYRSILEGLTLESAAAIHAVQHAGIDVNELIAIGGGATSPLWVQMLADATGQDLLVSDTQEASALGAAMLAARGAGWFHSPEDAVASMRGEARRVPPNTDLTARYAELIELQAAVYASNAAHFRTLARLRDTAVRQPAKAT